MPANPLDLAYYTFQPRKDQPHRNDQQTAFLTSQHPGITFLLGGNGAGTTTLALRKVVDFVLTTPPPRKDTPFWIIAKGFDQVMDVCWKEKLNERGHMPPQEVEWERIRWKSSPEGWPYSVPLKPWPGRPGKNWQLVFKSYDQGRQRMQAASIGGFLFVEQFPWPLLNEVMRGCRDYNFVGNKICEFTPIDPAMSRELQQMEQENELPDGWAIYRANTQCALESGHIDKSWFNNFFGMVPKSMVKARMEGLWAAFEGAVYPEFDTRIHCLPKKWVVPPGCHHRRSFDWGSGVDNAFVCLFMCRNGVGQWFVYDEYFSTEPLSTVQHLKIVSDLHYWPKGNPYYGQSWGDPSGLDRFRIAAQLPELAHGYDAIHVQCANNRVEEGIEHVRWLMEPSAALAGLDGRPQPRLFIDRDKCPNLVRELQTYRRVKSAHTGLNPRDAIDQVLKRDDHGADALRYCTFSEAVMAGMTPSTIARQHSAARHGIQLQSPKFKR